MIPLVYGRRILVGLFHVGVAGPLSWIVRGFGDGVLAVEARGCIGVMAVM